MAGIVLGISFTVQRFAGLISPHRTIERSFFYRLRGFKTFHLFTRQEFLRETLNIAE